MRHRLMLALVVAGVLVVPGRAGAQVRIGSDLSALPPGGQAHGDAIPVGEAGFFRPSSVAGQTFTVPTSASVLNAFEFLLTAWRGDPIFRFYIMGWDEAAFRPTGSIRHRSGPQALSTDAQETVRFTVGSLWLRPGAMYVAFLGTFDDPQPEGEAIIGLETLYFSEADDSPAATSPYAGGTAVQSVVDERTDLWTRPWEEIAGGGSDAEFSAEFEATTIPEPASMALLGTGLAGLIGAARRRRRNVVRE